MTENNNVKLEKLTRGNKEETKIMAGRKTYTIEEMEEEIKADTEVGKKLRSVEKELEKY